MSTDVKRVEPDVLWIKAGECFMFLLWCETVMGDFVVLKEGGEDMCKRYSESFGRGLYPSDFSRKRLEIGKSSFGTTKTQFLRHWPNWAHEEEVSDAIERVVIWRNGLGHANVQPFRDFLLFTPIKTSLTKIRKYTRCKECNEYLKDCKCAQKDVAEPRSVVVSRQTLETIFLDIRTVDLNCYYPTAKLLNIEYQGIAWPEKDGAFAQKIYHRVED